MSTDCINCKYYQEQGTLCQLTEKSVSELEECDVFEQSYIKAGKNDSRALNRSMMNAAQKMSEEAKKSENQHASSRVKICLWLIVCLAIAAVCYYFDRLGVAGAFVFIGLYPVLDLWEGR